MIDRKSPPALVLGQGLTLLGTVRCLGRAGVPTFVLTDCDPLACSSRWFRFWPGQLMAQEAYDALSGVLAALPIERGVLVPCSDPWAIAVGRLQEDLARRFPSVVASADVVEIFVDKGRFSRLLDQLDLPHPRTFEVNAPCDLAHLPGSSLEGGFLKPCDSVAFYSAFRVKAFDFRGRAEAEAMLARTHARGIAMMLQEYVPGPADNHYFVDGFASRDGEVRLLFARRRLRIFPPRFGNSTAMYSVALGEVGNAVASVRTLVSRAGLRGIFSAEFKRDQRDGVFKLLEVNARPWWYVEFAAVCGADVCKAAYRDALGLPPQPTGECRVGRRLVYPYYDWQAWYAQDPATRSSFRDLMLFWLGATQAVLRPDDPIPAVTAVARLARRWVARRVSQGLAP